MTGGGSSQWRSVINAVWLVAATASCADEQPGSDFSKTPVLLVHGSGMDSGVWDRMMEQLIRIGYPPQYLLAVDLVPNNGGNAAAASEQLSPAVETLIARSRKVAAAAGGGCRPTQIDIVAHSMGAASSRWYAAKLSPERVRTWVALAGANHGSDALRGFTGEGNREMVPAFAHSIEESAFQVQLNGTPEIPADESPWGLGVDRPLAASVRPDDRLAIAYFVIFIEPDEWIDPDDSAMLDGAGGTAFEIPPGVPAHEVAPGNFRFNGLTSHDALPRNPEVIRLVSALLLHRDLCPRLSPGDGT